MVKPESSSNQSPRERCKNLHRAGVKAANIEAYWAQQQSDCRPFDTLSIMGGVYNQVDHERCFKQLLEGLLNRNA